jgi:predicted DCC family thiol-disulfide oxidoreductase YuxK
MGELTVLYDESCALCARLTTRLRTLDGVSVVPIGSDVGRGLLGDLTPDERYASLHLVGADGRRRSGVDALPPLLRRLRGGTSAAWLIGRFPHAAARVYGLVARNRTRLSSLLLPAQARSVSRR